MNNNLHQYIYVTTTGWKSGKAHQIEIWYVAHNGNYYIVAEMRERAHWVQNIRNNPVVILNLGQRDAPAIPGTGRVVDRTAEPDLAAQVAALMDAKYHWSDGLIVELAPGSPTTAAV